MKEFEFKKIQIGNEVLAYREGGLGERTLLLIHGNMSSSAHFDHLMDALESAPIANPFGGLIDYSNGLRAGTQEMNLSKIDHSNKDGLWLPVKDLQTIESIIGK